MTRYDNLKQLEDDYSSDLYESWTDGAYDADVDELLDDEEANDDENA